MPTLTIEVDPTYGPIVEVAVAQTGLSQPLPALNDRRARFAPIVDTGADQTCISPSVATALGLSSTGMTEVWTASGHAKVNLYTVDIAVPLGRGLTVRADQGLYRANLEVVEMPKRPGCDILLGLDVLLTGFVIIDGSQRQITLCG